MIQPTINDRCQGGEWMLALTVETVVSRCG